jgi:Sporulation and spore germination
MKRLALVECVLSVLLAVPTCTSGASTTWPSTGSTPSSAEPPARGYPVTVYFSKHPQSDQNATAVFAVRRISPTLAVAAFAIRQLVVGPTRTETKAGYYSALAGLLHGPSDCGGPAARILLNRRGTAVEPGTATVRFCRRSMSGGIFDDVRVRSEISRTLTQFPSIKRVVILNKFGQCFGDLSGRNTCLRPLAP